MSQSVETKKPSPIKRKVKAIAAAGALGVATMFGANACKQVVHDIEYEYMVPEFYQVFQFYGDDITATKNLVKDIYDNKSLMNDNFLIELKYNYCSPIRIYIDDSDPANDIEYNVSTIYISGSNISDFASKFMQEIDDYKNDTNMKLSPPTAAIPSIKTLALNAVRNQNVRS
jgi:hypothetical protein